MAQERLAEVDIQWDERACACVVMASGGYPGSYPKGIEIHGLDANGQAEGVTVYHAGTKLEDGKFLTNGGRVLGVTALGDTLEQALSRLTPGWRPSPSRALCTVRTSDAPTGHKAFLQKNAGISEENCTGPLA